MFYAGKELFCARRRLFAGGNMVLPGAKEMLCARKEMSWAGNDLLCAGRWTLPPLPRMFPAGNEMVPGLNRSWQSAVMQRYEWHLTDVQRIKHPRPHPPEAARPPPVGGRFGSGRFDKR